MYISVVVYVWIIPEENVICGMSKQLINCFPVPPLFCTDFYLPATYRFFILYIYDEGMCPLPHLRWVITHSYLYVNFDLLFFTVYDKLSILFLNKAYAMLKMSRRTSKTVNLMWNVSCSWQSTLETGRKFVVVLKRVTMVLFFQNIKIGLSWEDHS